MYLVGGRKINFFGNRVQSPQYDSNLPPTSPAFLPHSIQTRRITFAHLIVEINQIIRGLRSLTFNVHRLQLLA
jgi:hypothetical protein